MSARKPTNSLNTGSKETQSGPQYRKVDSLGRVIDRQAQRPGFVVTPGAMRASEVDIKELMKVRIGSSDSNQSSVNSTDTAITDTNTAAQADVVTKYGFEDYEFYLDSVARDQISDLDNGVIQWTISNYNGGQELRSVIEFYINSFLFPRIVLPGTNSPDYFYFTRVYIEIVNTPTQSAVIAPNTTRYHFECAVNQPNSQAIELIPIKNTFYFRRPLDSLGVLQIRFAIPNTTPGSTGGFNYIQLPKENIFVNLVAGSNPARFTITNATTRVLAPIGTLPAGQGILIYFANAATGNPALDAQINNQNGVFVTNIVDDTNFEVGSIDATTGVASLNILAFIPKNRIAINFRNTSVVPNISNYTDISRP